MDMHMSQQVVERPSAPVISEEPRSAVAAPMFASWGRRLAAFSFDNILIFGGLVIVFTATQIDRIQGWELLGGALLLFILPLYFALCEGAWGQTLGKSA